VSADCCGGTCQPARGVQRDEHRPWWRRSETSTVLAGALIAAGAALAGAGAPASAIAAYSTAIGLSAPRPLRGAFTSIKRRTLDINVLMVIAVVGAVALGDWFEAAAVVWLFGVANWLEARSLSRARRAIRQLMTLAPAEALVSRPGGEVRVSVDVIVPGDVVIVRPGERLPVDGVVRAGSSSIDQSPVTGESFPIDVEAGREVFAGTINGEGALEVEALKPHTDTTIARIVHFVEEAESRRAPVQTWVDGFAKRYTPAVVLVAVLVAVGPPIFGGFGADSSTWFYRALALLVVACPCALVISTPVSIVSALTAAARAGVLIKGGAHLERLGGVKCVAFDKTGTLTAGKIRVTDVRTVGNASAAGVLSVAAALEARSEHPIARAIVDRARADRLSIPVGDSFRALPGLGAEGAVERGQAVIGSHRLFEDRRMCSPDLHIEVEAVESAGSTPVLVGHRGTGLGVLALSDEVREESRTAVRNLKREGVTHVVLLTGDHRATAEAVRAGAGLDDAHAGLLPEDKAAHVERLRSRYGPVAMVGDGINDAPALAVADVGIAMGVSGSDVAIETADVALLTDDLGKLPFAVRLGRAALVNIRTNVGIALGLKIAFIALAIGGVATLWMAVLADTGASLIVTANSLRLLRVR
jgi:Zn2+/Cd2+-exporting ATPase